MPEFKLGDTVKVTTPMKEYTGVVVYIFPANEEPVEYLRKKYYGVPKVGAKALKVDRLVVEYDEDRYFIAPVTTSMFINSIRKVGGAQ